MQKMRARFCNFPLQISHFDLLGSVAVYLFPDGAEYLDASYGQRLAQMDASGTILVSPPEFSRLANVLMNELTLDQAARIRRAHRQRLLNLQAQASQVLKTSLESWPAKELQCFWFAIANAIAELAPYGLLTKLLLKALLQRTGGVFPDSASLRLPTQEEFAALLPQLSSSALVLGLRRLANFFSSLDDSETGAAQRKVEIEKFCRDYTGHGPKAWEAPGYENPEFVWRAVQQVQALPSVRNAQTAGQQTSGLKTDDSAFEARQDFLPGSENWEQELRYWIFQMDIQSTVMRWGFFTAEWPLLCELATRGLKAGAIREPENFLFCTRQEMAQSLPSFEELDRRRGAYQALFHGSCPRLGRTFEAQRGKSSRSSIWPQVTYPAAPPRFPQAARTNGEELFWGQSASSTTARSGPAWPLFSDSALPGKASGVVVIARHLTPNLTPVLLGAVAVVVEEGGLLQHAAIVARELGIPCIVGCRGLMERVRPGMPVTVDGSNGKVTLQR